MFGGVDRGGGRGCKRHYPRLGVGGVCAEFCHVPHGAGTGAYLLRGRGRLSEGNGSVGQPGKLDIGNPDPDP